MLTQTYSFSIPACSVENADYVPYCTNLHAAGITEPGSFPCYPKSEQFIFSCTKSARMRVTAF